jgi:hypothetical protein
MFLILNQQHNQQCFTRDEDKSYMIHYLVYPVKAILSSSLTSIVPFVCYNRCFHINGPQL